MKGLFSRRNAWMLAAVLVILGVGCAFGLSRGQKAMTVNLPAMQQSAERDSLSVTAQATEDMPICKRHSGRKHGRIRRDHRRERGVVCNGCG